MVTSDGRLEVHEIESGTYVFPAIGKKKLPPTWALFVYSNGDAEFYTKRHPKTGALLGKPMQLGNPWDFCNHDEHGLDEIPKGDPRNPYKSDNHVCRNCGKEFRPV
jgi:hypothetical protein